MPACCLLQLVKERDDKVLPLDLRTGGTLGDDASQAAEAFEAEGGAKKQFVKKGKATQEEVDQPEFTKVEVKVGQITKVWAHPESDKLWCEEINIGDKFPKQVASGLREHFTEEQMKHRRLLVVVNLKSQTMGKFTSGGMVLCAKAGEKVVFVNPPEGALIGETVFAEGLTGFKPYSANQMKKNKVLEKVFPDLKTDAAGIATWAGKKLITSTGPCTAELPDAQIS